MAMVRSGKVAVKGSGESNGSPVNFVSYTYRGCVNGTSTNCVGDQHRFRIVVWPRSAGLIPTPSTVVYDNRKADGYDVVDGSQNPISFDGRHGVVAG